MPALMEGMMDDLVRRLRDRSNRHGYAAMDPTPEMAADRIEADAKLIAALREALDIANDIRMKDKP